nr:hypothetical protein Iba_chr08cCG2210 [Ipomoea batatas]
MRARQAVYRPFTTCACLLLQIKFMKCYIGSRNVTLGREMHTTKSFYKRPSSTLASHISPVHTRRAIRVRLVRVEAPQARAKDAFFHDKEEAYKDAMQWKATNKTLGG